jgi:hypothetical protein
LRAGRRPGSDDLQFTRQQPNDVGKAKVIHQHKEET